MLIVQSTVYVTSIKLLHNFYVRFLIKKDKYIHKLTPHILPTLGMRGCNTVRIAFEAISES